MSFLRKALARCGERGRGVVESPGEPAKQLVDLRHGNDERRRERNAVSDDAHDDAVLPRGALEDGAQLLLGAEGPPGLLVLDDLEASDKADGVCVADDRMVGEAAEGGKETRAHVPDVAD